MKETSNLVDTYLDPTQLDPSKRTLANRQNALKSTGPKSDQGKQRVSMNAFKHGLSGQNLYLQTEEYVPYFKLASEYIGELRPVGVREEQIAQKIIDSNWRLNRAAAIENNILSTAILHADTHELVNIDDETTVGMVGQSIAWQKQNKNLEALSRHETRISRFMARMEKEIEQLQEKRFRREGKDTFVLEESRAWHFYNDALSHQLTLRDQQKAKEKEQAPPEVTQPLDTKDLTAQAEALALNCKKPNQTPAELIQNFAILNEFVASTIQKHTDASPAPVNGGKN